jgi:hypothetical protein
MLIPFIKAVPMLVFMPPSNGIAHVSPIAYETT